MTPIPLSPEESYLASQHMGRSLFAALQLMRDQERMRSAADKKLQDDGSVLKIPIPKALMPSKVAAVRTNHSVVEQPGGELNYKKTETETRKHHSKPSGVGRGALLGGLASAAMGTPATPALIAGGVVGGLVDSKPGYSGLKFQKTVKHLDGSLEHLYDIEKNPGAAALIKRNLGKLVGTAGGLAAIKALPPSKLKLLLPLAGLSMGHGVDKWNKEQARIEAGNKPEQQADLLSDVELLRSKTGSELIDPGILGRAFSQVNRHPARILFGAQDGFRNAKKDFFLQEKQRLADEEMKAQKEYIDVLSQIAQTKRASVEETPNVDAFCNGLACVALLGDKTAAEDMSSGAANRLASEIFGKAIKPVRKVTDPAVTGLVGAGALSTYLTSMLREQMRKAPEKYMEEQLPTRVEFQPY